MVRLTNSSAKKHRRQMDPVCFDNISESSTESCDDSNLGEKSSKKCQHAPRAINLCKLKRNIKKAGFGVDCTACKKDNVNSGKNKEDETKTPVLWICLQCGNLACGRTERQHALEHSQKPYSDLHCLVVDTQQWTIWCYLCEELIAADTTKKLLETVEVVKKLYITPRAALQTRNAMLNHVETVKQENEVVNEKCKRFPGIVGLMNLGNTCFFNAVLQCLAQTPFLLKILDDLQAPEQKFVLPGGIMKSNKGEEETELKPIEGSLDKIGSFTGILHKTLTEMQNTNSHTYVPKELYSCLRKKTIHCIDGGQHDSHELLRHLLEIVRNEDLRRYQHIILKEVGLSGKTNPDCVGNNLKSQIKFYGNQASARLLGVEPVFRGVLVSTLECLDCHKSSARTEPFLDLSLPIMTDRPQPPAHLFRKENNNFKDTHELIGKHGSKFSKKKNETVENNVSEYKKTKSGKQKRQNHKISHKNSLSNQNNAVDENKDDNIIQSEESYADVEDNIDVDDSLHNNEEFNSIKESPQLDNKLVTNNLIENQTSNLINSNEEKQEDTNLNKVQENLSSNNLVVAEAMQVKLSSDTENKDNSNCSKYNNSLPSLDSLSLNSKISSPNCSQDKDCASSDELSTKNIDFSNANVTNEDNTQLLISNNSEPKDENNSTTCEVADTLKSDLAQSSQQSPNRFKTIDGEWSLQSCLNQFTALELLTKSNKVGCEKCTEREKKNSNNNVKTTCTPHTKQYLISKAPAILILHLKRGQTLGENFRKFSRHVKFPLLFDLSPVCKKFKNPRIYSLYGLIVHKGQTQHGGHYIAYIKSRSPLAPDDPRWSFVPSRDALELNEKMCNSVSDSDEEIPTTTSTKPPPGKWYCASDTWVTEVDEATILRSQAYMLFYERIL